MIQAKVRQDLANKDLVNQTLVVHQDLVNGGLEKQTLVRLVHQSLVHIGLVPQSMVQQSVVHISMVPQSLVSPSLCRKMDSNRHIRRGLTRPSRRCLFNIPRA